MALTIKKLNADASFLLSFEPISDSGALSVPFTILLDPWITGPSTMIYSRFSVAVQRGPACIESLRELPAPPDLVVISQHKPDHCNEASLRQLPPHSTKTVILAEPAAAKTIRRWRHFERGKIQTLPRWKDSRSSGRQTVVRITVPPRLSGGEPGEVTVASIGQKNDWTGVHSAIAITYRPPPSRLRSFRALLTPPATPGSRAPCIILPPADALLLTPPIPPAPPGGRTLRSVRSIASLSPHAYDRAVSVVFAPHGISYSSLEPYATSHLVTEAALPLTALLHCFESVSRPWWLGGAVCTGAAVGQETADALGAQVWVSTHDHHFDLRGLAARFLRTYSRQSQSQEPTRAVGARGKEKNQEKRSSGEGQTARAGQTQTERVGRAGQGRGGGGTQTVVLGAGDEILLTSKGLWKADTEEAILDLSSVAESSAVMPNMAELLS